LESPPEGRSFDVLACLRRCRLLAFLGEAELLALARAGSWVTARGGSLLIREGEPGDAAFVVASGRLQVVRAIEGNEVVVGEIGPGELVGEIALVAQRPRTATVRAIRDTELVRISPEGLRRAAIGAPGLMAALTGVIVDRLLDSRPLPPAQSVRTLALVPLGSRPLPAAVAEAMRRALDRLGGCELVGPERVEAMLLDEPDDAPAPDRAGSRLGEWLSHLEAASRFVLYVADPRFERWSARCLRQADRILLVHDGSEEPVTVDARAGWQSLPVRRELLILHPPGTERPSGSAQLLERLAVAAHHHVRQDRQGDFERVARLMTGRGTGVVLGGGAARGWAHLGVLRGLEELGHQVDAIGGTSIGGLMAASFAVFADAERRERILEQGLAGPRRLFRMTLPIASLSSGRTVTDALRAPGAFSDLRIEDCWLPLFLVSTNLTTAQPKVHRDGPIWRAARASVSIPGLLPPVCEAGELLVDGAILDNLPIGVMHDQLQGGRVIAVDVEPAVDLKVGRPFEPSVSGWKLLLNQLNPLRESLQVPRMAAVVARSQAVRGPHHGSWRLDEAAGDVLLRPPTGGSRAFDFRSSRELIEAAHRYTLERLAGPDQPAGTSPSAQATPVPLSPQ
jgi:predicted acylesterase/phospholipase RssA/CRP-like cAMP-binding protein